MAEKTVLHSLQTGMVLDRAVLITLPATEMAHVIQSVRAAAGKPLYVCDGAETFFTTASLMSLITQKDERYKVVNEGLGGFFTQGQLDVMLQAPAGVIKPAAIVGHPDPLVVNLGAGGGGNGAYEYAPTPAGWSISGNMSLGLSRIKRKVKNSDGDGALFAMTPQDYEKLWLFASKAWAGIENAPLTATFQTYSGKLKATVQDDRISLGGNYVRRYEIEQIAKYRDWAKPIDVAHAA